MGFSSLALVGLPGKREASRTTKAWVPAVLTKTIWDLKTSWGWLIWEAESWNLSSVCGNSSWQTEREKERALKSKFLRQQSKASPQLSTGVRTKTGKGDFTVFSPLCSLWAAEVPAHGHMSIWSLSQECETSGMSSYMVTSLHPSKVSVNQGSVMPQEKLAAVTGCRRSPSH